MTSLTALLTVTADTPGSAVKVVTEVIEKHAAKCFRISDVGLHTATFKSQFACNYRFFSYYCTSVIELSNSLIILL